MHIGSELKHIGTLEQTDPFDVLLTFDIDFQFHAFLLLDLARNGEVF